MKKLISVALLVCSLGAVQAQAETTEGVLEKGPSYSALFSVSPESGDLVGYAFKNQSPVGKSILQRCLPGMLCRIQTSSQRSMGDTSALKFADHPSAWLEITQARGVQMAAVVQGYDSSVKTRHGTVSVRAQDHVLLFRGKPVVPVIEGNSGMSIVASYEQGQAAVLLMQNTGGSACPAVFRVLTVAAGGVRMTPEFGTCSDIIYPSFDAKTGLKISMVRMGEGPLAKTVYQWSPDGRLTENGQPVR
jgi:hypothetical protein